MTPYSWKRLLVLGVMAGMTVWAQAPPPQPQAAPPQQQQFLSADQLDDLVAPIALYPDQLLSQVLVASTYPLEIVEAQQWLQQNRNLTGSQLMDAAREQSWDPSVQAMVALPDVLARLNQDIRWTTDLGNAFLAQQADVMSAVQRMRARAKANGRLESTPQQTVTSEVQGDQSAIQIQPSDPNIIYVPTYDPMYVWGPPVYGYYPSLYYPSFGFGWGSGINIGLCFGGWGGWGGWGWGPNWFGRSVFVNNTFFGRYGFHRGYYGGFRGGYVAGGRSVWTHDPGHRLGISYPNRSLAGRYNSASLASRASSQRYSGQGSNGRSFAGNAGGASAARQGGWQSFGNRSAGQAGNSYRGGASPQAGGRSYQSQGNYRSGQAYQSAPRSYSGSNYSNGGRQYGATAPRSYGGGTPNYGGGAARSFNGGSGRQFGGGAAPSFNGGGARSFSSGGGSRGFSGGSAPARSFGGGGGGARSFGGGGGARSFGGGGGGHAGGGGGHHR